MLSDLKSALRTLTRRPGFAAIAVISLALGIGATTAIFSVVNGVLLRPLPYRDAGALAVLRGSYADMQDVKDAPAAFAGFAVSASNMYDVSGEGGNDHLRGDIVTPDFFSVTGVAPVLGSAFTPAQDREPLVILSWGLWQRRYGGGHEVLGKKILLNGVSHTIAGVMPSRFHLPAGETTLWVTMGSAMGGLEEQMANRSFRIFTAIARLAPGVSPRQAQAAVDVTMKRLAASFPATNAEVGMTVRPLREALVGPVRPLLLILLGTVGLVLLIACANVANLMLARMTAREREIALRMALGAGRGRIVRQLLTESALLALVGGAAGALLAMWGIDLLQLLSPKNLPRLDEVRLDGVVLAFTFGLSLLTGLAFGLLPALDSVRPSLASLIRDGRGATEARRSGRLRQALVIGEVALSLVLVIGAGLLAKSFLRLMDTHTGVKADHLLTFGFTPSPKYPDQARRNRFFDDAFERIAAVPGVESVAGATSLPPTILQRGVRFGIEGMVIPPDDNGAAWVSSTPDFFRALGADFVAGRPFVTRDDDHAPPVVIINRAMARRLFGDEVAAVGRRLELIQPGLAGGWRTIVGVAGDIKYQGLASHVFDTIYTPFRQTPFSGMYVMVRTHGDPAAAAGAVRAAVAAVDADQSLGQVRPMIEVVGASVAQPRFNALMLGLFGVVAVALAMIGVYGLISYGVAQRTREIGIRMALGARRTDVVRMVVWQGAWLALAGVALGVVAALGLTRLLASLLFEVRPSDPLTYAALSALLLLVAVLASFLPARKAARVDPMVALRSE